MNLVPSVSALFLSLAAGLAAAQTYTPHLDQREAHLQTRIGQGVVNGSLTPAEAARAQYGLAQIHAYEAWAKSDGIVTRYERHHLKQMENRESRLLGRLKHNHRAI